MAQSKPTDLQEVQRKWMAEALTTDLLAMFPMEVIKDEVIRRAIGEGHSLGAKKTLLVQDNLEREIANAQSIADNFR